MISRPAYSILIAPIGEIEPALCESIRVLHENKERIPGVEVTHGRDLNLRHFKSRYRFKS